MTPDENPVRDIHNAVAGSIDLAEASCRVQGTTSLELGRMIRDVMRKLDVSSSDRVLDIGCGVGVIGVPLAQRAAEYVGIDIADQAIAALSRRFATLGLGPRASAVVLDLVAAPDEEVHALGTFNRTLAYAALHYVRNDAEGERFVHRALSLTQPGGRALFGNLPLDELDQGIWPPTSERRLHTDTMRWVFGRHPRVAGIGVPRRWRMYHLAYSKARRHVRTLRGAGARPPASLPPGYVVTLSRKQVERWVATAPVKARCEWQLSSVGTPQYYSRVDLIVDRD